jgi:hypothetical protein
MLVKLKNMKIAPKNVKFGGCGCHLQNEEVKASFQFFEPPKSQSAKSSKIISLVNLKSQSKIKKLF